MHGLHGTRTRAWIITAEFVFGAVGCVGLGALPFLVDLGTGWKLFGACLIGAGLNYVPLAIHVISLWRPGALAAELEGVDIRRELRRYTALQVWVAVPLAIVIFALIQLRRT
jgi:hypothetical protein